MVPANGKGIANYLHGYGRKTLAYAASTNISHDGAYKCVPVDAIVLVESAILGCDECLTNRDRDSAQRNVDASYHGQSADEVAGPVKHAPPFVGVKLHPLTIVASIGVMLLIGLGLTGIGILIAAKMTSFEGFGTINNFIVMPLYFTSAAQFPLTRAPHWLRALARFNPVSYGVDMLRGTIVGVWTYTPALDLAVLVGFAAVVLAAATYSFNKQE